VVSIIKFIDYFLSDITFKVLDTGEISMLKEIKAGMPQSSILSPSCISFIKHLPPEPTPSVHIALFADDTCIYTTETKKVMFSESCSIVPVQWRGSECWNIKINEDKTQAIYFSHRFGQVEDQLTLNTTSLCK
jgi:hypothetical protein